MADLDRSAGPVPAWSRRRWLVHLTGCTAAACGVAPRAVAASYPLTAAAMRTARDQELAVHQRYVAAGRKAQQDGYLGIAYLFTAFAAAERVHADTFARILARLDAGAAPAPVIEPKVGSTRENLIAAANGELQSVDAFYPQLLERIRPEGHEEAITAVRYAWGSEQRHRDKLLQVQRWSPSFFEQVARTIDAKTGQYHVCQVCGCTLNQLPAQTCPVCKGLPTSYRHIDAPA